MVVASVDEVSGLTVARLKEELAARGLSKEGVKVHSYVYHVFVGCVGIRDGVGGVAALVEPREFLLCAGASICCVVARSVAQVTYICFRVTGLRRKLEV